MLREFTIMAVVLMYKLLLTIHNDGCCFIHNVWLIFTLMDIVFMYKILSTIHNDT